MNDLISRQAAIEMLNDNELERQADDVFDGDLHRYKRAAQRIIAQLPTIEPKRGKWEMKSDPYGFFDEIPVCSACGCTTKWREKYAYCPNCGAKIEK